MVVSLKIPKIIFQTKCGCTRSGFHCIDLGRELSLAIRCIFLFYLDNIFCFDFSKCGKPPSPFRLWTTRNVVSEEIWFSNSDTVLKSWKVSLPSTYQYERLLANWERSLRLSEITFAVTDWLWNCSSWRLPHLGAACFPVNSSFFNSEHIQKRSKISFEAPSVKTRRAPDFRTDFLFPLSLFWVGVQFLCSTSFQ